MTIRSLALIILLIAVSSAQADDWPQWRGPDRSGVSKETGLLKEWPKDKGPKLLWTYRNAGSGHSSFAVVGDKFYTLGTRGPDEIVLALDANKGTELWTARIGPIFTFMKNTWGDGPRSTPAIDGDRLYALGGQGDLVCFDLSQKGKEVWRRNFQTDFGGEMMTEWGYCESPLVDGDMLVCTPGGDKGTLVALNKKDGKLLWQSSALKNKAPYSSIMPATIHGVRQYIQNSYDPAVGGFISGVNAPDGKVLWTMPLFTGDSFLIAPSPIVHGNLVYVTTNNTVSGCHCFELDMKFNAKDLYSKANQKVMQNNFGGVLLIDGHIYGYSSENKGWVCQEFKTGAMAWSEKDSFPCKAGAITAAEGLIYILTDQGEVGLIKANSKEFNEVSSFKLPEKSKLPQTLPTSRDSAIWAHPVVANGRLYVRDHDLIFCFDVKGK